MNDVPETGSQPPRSPMPPGAILPSNPPKDPIAVLLFNVFFVSVGYFIIGQWQKGIVGAIGFIFELMVSFGIGFVIPGCGTCIVIPISLVIHAVLSADGYLQAQVLKSGRAISQWTFFNQHL